jgi:hypothetical protein
MSKIVVYTCITGKRDRPKRVRSPNEYRYVMFTDETNIQQKRWEVFPIQFQHKDPCRVARYYKHNPHILFPDADFSIWIDGTLSPIGDLEPILKNVDNHIIAAYAHPQRKTTYDEAAACIRLNKDSPQLIISQMNKYREAGFPDNLGLYCTPVLVRKHCWQMANLQNAWWGEICSGSRRDQLSFTYCLWKLSISCKLMAGSYHPGANPYFYMSPHYPIDFIPLL